MRATAAVGVVQENQWNGDESPHGSDGLVDKAGVGSVAEKRLPSDGRLSDAQAEPGAASRSGWPRRAAAAMRWSASSSSGPCRKPIACGRA